MTSELLRKFLAKNASMFTMLGFREQCFLATICPKKLKALSDDAFEVQMHKYFFTSLASVRNVASCTFHHSKGSNQNLVVLLSHTLLLLTLLPPLEYQ